jgi:glycosyltransferase involved in cell wall biosynthesis
MNQWHQKDIVLLRLIAAKLCHKVVALTEQSREDYRKRFLMSRKKVGCIYNWIDLDGFRSAQYNGDSKRIVSAGRFGREKGFDMLVKAFAPVAKKHPDWKLEIFGDGEMMPTVKQLVAELGLENSVELLGMRTDLAHRYGDYAFYVLPSYREGMPLVLLEAKANHLPIVSFDIQTGPREIVRDGIDGLLVQPYDLDKLGDSMCRLIENKELREEMSRRSQDNLDVFAKETILRQWLTLIEDL